MTRFKAGDKVRVDGERGNRYVVMQYEQDGSVRLWGGSTNPNRWRGVKSVKEDRLIPIKK
jgi:uncharacterized protein YodC (DUF2158 family)